MATNNLSVGLRIPEARYREIKELSGQMGVSFNALILMLVDLGLGVREGRFSLMIETAGGRE